MSGYDIPRGFSETPAGRTTLIADARVLDQLKRAGLDRAAAWDERLQGSELHAGRGATGRLELQSGEVLRLKQLRRGGLVGPFWRDCFAGPHRPLQNLRLPVEASRRGIATPVPIALLIVRQPLGFVRAWLALEEIADATNLAACFASSNPPTPAELASVIAQVRRVHDLGLEHRDLNLGNLLIRRTPEGLVQTHVVDLDSAKLHRGPLGFHLRQRALRRLERSHVKLGIRAEGFPDLYYPLYAGDDTVLAARLAKGRRAGRAWLSLHRLGWRLRGVKS